MGVVDILCYNTGIQIQTDMKILITLLLLLKFTLGLAYSDSFEKAKVNTKTDDQTAEYDPDPAAYS